MLYHLVPRAEFEQQAADTDYVTDSLAAEGFIHLSATPEAVTWVANAFYRDVADLVVLRLDEIRLAAPVRYDQTPDGIFPHLYGPLNRDAIVTVEPMLRDQHGRFVVVL